MNKQNSMGVENELSTEINDSTKSYSSRFRQLKAIKSNSKCRYGEVLPFRREKAAVTIQRFWRLRKMLRRKLYQQLLNELKTSSQILEFQNTNLDNLISIYTQDCEQLESYYVTSSRAAVEQAEKEANDLIKQMAIMTFKMERRIIDENEIKELFEQHEEWKVRIKELSTEKEDLKSKLSGELQVEQSQFLRKIKEQNTNLLRVSKQKNEAQKIMRQKLIQTCKTQMKL